MSQEPTLFATSIYDNIAQGRPGASAEEVEAAARAANAHSFVMGLPEGYKTQVRGRACTAVAGLECVGGVVVCVRQEKTLIVGQRASAAPLTLMPFLSC